MEATVAISADIEPRPDRWTSQPDKRLWHEALTPDDALIMIGAANFGLIHWGITGPTIAGQDA
jgi:hypothetical protein